MEVKKVWEKPEVVELKVSMTENCKKPPKPYTPPAS